MESEPIREARQVIDAGQPSQLLLGVLSFHRVADHAAQSGLVEKRL